MISPDVDLTKLDLEALKEIAQEEDLEGRSKLTRKADLLGALEELQLQQLESSDSTPEFEDAPATDVPVGERAPARVFGREDAVSVPHVLATLNSLRARDGRYVDAALVGARLSVRRQIGAEDVLAVAKAAGEQVDVKGDALTLTNDGLIAVRGRMTPRRFVAGL